MATKYTTDDVEFAGKEDDVWVKLEDYEMLEKTITELGKSNEKLTAELICQRDNVTELRRARREQHTIEEIKTAMREVMAEQEITSIKMETNSLKILQSKIDKLCDCKMCKGQYDS